MKGKTRKYLLSATALLLFLSTRLIAQSVIDYKSIPKLIEKAIRIDDTQRVDSLAKIYINDYLFKQTEKKLFTRENLAFISEHLQHEKSKAFRLFMNQPEKINAVLGDQKAQYGVMHFITKMYFGKKFIDERDSVDWDDLEIQLSRKFGALGLETVLGQKMVYYLSKSDWKAFSENYVAYFDKALKHPMYDINNISWPIFQHVTDPQILQLACGIMEYAIENWDQSHEALDTYANILYKIGKKEKAIEWEQKALWLSNNSEQYSNTLQKMKTGKRTW